MKVIVIGNGPAALKAIKALTFTGSVKDITIISRERELSYAPYFLAKYVSSEIVRAQLYVCDKSFYASMETFFGDEVVDIFPEKEKIRLSNGKELSYEKLLIAAGANALIPSLDGLEGEGVFTFKTLEDAEKIIAVSEKGKRAVVMGGGFIGLEIAEALCKVGCHVTVIERENRVLPRMLDREMSQLVQSHMEKHGIIIKTGTRVEYVNRSLDRKLRAVETDKGDSHDCDILIVASGVVPNLEIVQNSSLATDRGILVDQHMQTNNAHIYAAGDIAEVQLEDGRWMNPIHINAVKGGQIAGLNMIGLSYKYESFHEFMNVVTFFGLPVLSLGVQKGSHSIKHSDSKGVKKIYFKENGAIRGVQLIGDVKQGGIFLSLIERGVTFSNPRELLVGAIHFRVTVPPYL
jgi:NAD(P)H-nitrite reductase large subunit